MKRFASLMLVAGFFAAAGCGDSGGVAVEGKLVEGGKDYRLSDDEAISLSLISDDAKNDCNANVEKDGTFSAKGSLGKLVPPGKYKVMIVHYKMDPKSKSSPTPPEPRDTGEVWDVTSSSKTFTLDIGKIKEADKKKSTTQPTRPR